MPSYQSDKKKQGKLASFFATFLSRTLFKGTPSSAPATASAHPAPPEKPKGPPLKEPAPRSLPTDCMWVCDRIRLIGYGSVQTDDGVQQRGCAKTTWSYKNGFFSPWIQPRLFEAYLKTKGLEGSNGTYNGRKYKLYADGWPHYHEMGEWQPHICLMLDFVGEFNVDFEALAAIAEEYCLSGYDPGEEVVRELVEKYQPARVSCDSESMPYHDESDIIYIFHNAQDEVMFKDRFRDYVPLRECLEQNVGRSHLFGLHREARATAKNQTTL